MKNMTRRVMTATRITEVLALAALLVAGPGAIAKAAPRRNARPRSRPRPRQAGSEKKGAKARRSQKSAKLPSAKWLIQDAEKAINRGQLPKAVALYRGAAALRDQEPKLVFRLAEIYRMAGQFAEASQEFRRFIKLSKDAKKKAEAQKAIRMMAAMPAPFVDRDVSASVQARSHGVKAFKRGLRYAKKGKSGIAIRYFEASLMLDPSLVGALRWLGQMYARTKNEQQAAAYYARYLRVMPAGRNARLVRKRLEKLPVSVLGKATFRASFPCQIWLNRMPLKGKKTPVKDFLLPEGEYTVVFYNEKYHIGRKKRVFIKPGKEVKIDFQFGILEVKLDPWARVRIEGRDVGLWPKLGIPARQKPYEVSFVSHDGKKRMKKLITIQPKKKVVIQKWR